MRLYWAISTCAQTGLKCISFRPALTLLPQTHGPQYSKIDQSPTTQKGPAQSFICLYNYIEVNEVFGSS